jgi:hypothetical protein
VLRACSEGPRACGRERGSSEGVRGGAIVRGRGRWEGVALRGHRRQHGRLVLENALLHLQDGDIEGTTAKNVDSDDRVVGAVQSSEAARQWGRGRGGVHV